jgi:hypothetical protein
LFVKIADSLVVKRGLMEMTEQNNTQMEESNVSSETNLSSTNSRRKFLTKAAVGATIASIPAHSVWAGRLISGNMSGNVSGWGECEYLAIWSHGKFKSGNNDKGKGRISSTFQTETWLSVFGVARPPFRSEDGDEANTLQYYIDQEAQNTGQQKKQNDQQEKKKATVNAQIATMYVNASLHGSEGVNWPVVPTPFATTKVYARYLWDQANLFGEGVVADQLGAIIKEHHAGGEGLHNTCDDA